ncbi:uncharacterized protein LOC131885359 [Tigriopus californicus]|uniref:uncharacterized protein LOC131885359 n=1 Tax=Tigriopus californicus TaxID=6832 RepID=UPI0027DA982C|nr:uncharacterized protein LOC131885359 [Tigriopus californicus]
MTNGACGTTADAVRVSSPFSSSANAFPPTICGTLTGQHMYFETGDSGIAGALTIAKGSGTGNRNYQIKVTYLTCDNLARAPAGCTQYFTGLSGNFQSYNFPGGQLLQAMNYNNCFRQEEGYCQLQVREAASTIPDTFQLSGTDETSETTCTTLSSIILTTPNVGTFCGGSLNPVAGNMIPAVVTSSPGTSFQVGLQTLTTDLSDLTGFNLDYNQVPCA